MINIETYPIINGGQGHYFDKAKDQIISIGYVCPRCKTVLAKSLMGYICQEPKCPHFMQAPFLTHEQITTSENSKKNNAEV